MNFTHVRPLAPLVWSLPSVPSLAPILADRKSCSASAVGSLQTPALSSETDSVRQDLLGAPTPHLVFVEDGAHRGNARNRGPLAPLGVSALLAVPLTRAEPGRQKAGDAGDPRSNL